MLNNKYLRLMLVAGIVVILDQITKALILNSLELHQSVTVIPGFFDLARVHNPGGAFGFLAKMSSTVRTVIFLFVSSLAVGLVLYLYATTPAGQPFLAVGFALIFGGAIGNLIDRIRFGYVVDFLDVYTGDLHWPAFNIADSAITVGIIIFAYHIIFKKIPG